MRVFIEAERGSRRKGMYDERTLERQGERRAALPYPYPYGSVLGTQTEDGDAVDCYVITKTELREGSTVRCELLGLLEFFEEDEVDHKVLAAIPGEKVAPDERLREELEGFIYGIFSVYPDMQVRVGRLLSKQAAIDHIRAAGDTED